METKNKMTAEAATKKLNFARGSRENKDVGGVPVELGSPTIRTVKGFRKCIIIIFTCQHSEGVK